MSMNQQKLTNQELFDQVPLKKEIDEQKQINCDQPPNTEQDTFIIPKSPYKQLKIRNSLIISREKMKKKKFVTKVHSVKSDDQQILSPSSSIPSIPEEKSVFSLDVFQKENLMVMHQKPSKGRTNYTKVDTTANHEKNTQNIYSEIIIEDCLVNIYALKRLIDLTSTNLATLSIRACLFYTDDNSVLMESQKLNQNDNCKIYEKTQEEKDKRNDEKLNSSNNKMLKEINFTFLINTLQFPLIQSIKIELLSSTVFKQKEQQVGDELTENSIHLLQAQIAQRRSSNFSKRNQLQQQITTVDQIVNEYECDKDSQFVDFELNIQPMLEKKFAEFKTEKETVDYIIHGEKQDKQDIQSCMNESILNEITEHITVYNKFIKDSLHNGNILLIRGYLLEDPIAMGMISNVIIKYQERIQTVIFKETGTIPHECFLKISDALVSITNLESVAFFDAQPEQQSYKLLKDVIVRESSHLHCFSQKKKFLLVVLNRSSFDIDEYRFQVFGQNRVQEDSEDDESESAKTIPKHYAFYILDEDDIYEFSPYRSFFENSLFISKQNNEEEGKQQQDNKQCNIFAYEIEDLIERQENYKRNIKEEILKYQDEAILTFSGVCEKIIDTKEKSQQQIENEIRILIKHSNKYNLIKAKNIVSGLRDLVLFRVMQKELKSKGIQCESGSEKIIINESNVDTQFMIDIGLCRNIPYNIIGESLVRRSYKVKKYSRRIEIKLRERRNQHKNVTNFIQCCKKQQIIQINLEFKSKYYYVNMITKSRDGVKGKHQIVDKVQNESFYQNSQFYSSLKDIFSICVEISQLQISLEYDQLENKQEILSQHLRFFQLQKVVHIRNVNITGNEEYFRLPLISQDINIKFLNLSRLLLDNESFPLESTSIANFNIFKCTIKTLSADLSNQLILNLFQINEEEQNKNYLPMSSQEDWRQIQERQNVKKKQKINAREIYFEEQQSMQGSKVVDLSKKCVSFMMNRGGRFSFNIDNLGQETISYFLEEMISRFSGNLNRNLLTKFYGLDFSSKSGFQFRKEDSEIKQNINNDIISSHNNISHQVTDLPEQLQTQKSEQKSISKYAQTTFNQLKEIYSCNFVSQFSIYSSEKKFLYSEKFIPNCCKLSLRGDCQTFSIKDKNHLMNILKGHTDDFCLFRTSIFQQPFKPRKICIKFFHNLFINKAVVYDEKELEFIEELDFSGSQFHDILQIKFIDYMIQLSPKLQKLKLKNMQLRSIPFRLSPLNNLIHLKSINFNNNYINDIYSLMHPFLQCQGIISLKSFVIQPEFFISSEDIHVQNYELLTKSFLKNNKTSFRTLSVGVFTKNNLQEMMLCTSLETLSVQLYDFKQSEIINDIKEISKFKVLKVNLLTSQYQDAIISQSCLENIFKTSTNSSLTIISLNGSDNSYSNNRIIDSSQIENHHCQIVQVFSKTKVEIEDPENLQKKVITFDQFVSQNPNLSITRLSDIENFSRNQTIPQLKYLQELHLNKLKSYAFLNTLFQVNQECLIILSFYDCQLQNNSLEDVDFRMLPKSVKLLSFRLNKDLTELKFLHPLHSNISAYSKMILDVKDTFVNFSEVYKFIPHIKKVEFEQDFSELYPLIHHRYKNILDEQYQVQITDLVLKICRLNTKSKEMPFLQLILNNKKELDDYKYSNSCPFIISPLQIITSTPSFHQETNLIYNMQKSDTRFSLHKQLGNKYLLIIKLILDGRHKFILGYNKNFHGSHFDILKAFSHTYQCLSDNEHLFFDYLLLLKMQETLNLQQIHLSLNLEISYSLIHNNKRLQININESTMIENLSRIPPSELTIHDLSLQFIKSWYVINFISPLTFNTTIKYIDMNQVYNSSIGNYLTQQLDRNNLIKKILSRSPLKYRYDETVQLLASHLDDQIKDKKHFQLLSLFPLYLFICIFGVMCFSFQCNFTCGEGISWYSYYSYLVYGIITIIIELMLFSKCLNFISHLVPSLEISMDKGCINQLINSFKKFVIDSTWINQWLMGYSYSFLQSQLARFDNFTNAAFLYTAYQCENYNIFYISLCFISIPILHSLYEFIHLLFKPTRRYKLPTQSLDTYYKICNIIEFKAVADILDLVSPSNTTVIRGRMYNSRIVSCFIRIIGESIPLVVIQIYNLSQSTLTSSLVLSILLSIITFLTLLINFLTIMPSTLSQEDFNKLNEKKRINQVVQKYEQRLETFEYETFALKFYSYLKNIRLQYLKGKQLGNLNEELEDQYNDNIRYFKLLFDLPKQEIEKELEEEKRRMAEFKNQH